MMECIRHFQQQAAEKWSLTRKLSRGTPTKLPNQLNTASMNAIRDTIVIRAAIMGPHIRNPSVPPSYNASRALLAFLYKSLCWSFHHNEKTDARQMWIIQKRTDKYGWFGRGNVILKNNYTHYGNTDYTTDTCIIYSGLLICAFFVFTWKLRFGISAIPPSQASTALMNATMDRIAMMLARM